MKRTLRLSGLVSLILILNVASIAVWESLPRTEAGEETACVAGDVNDDGQTTILDALHILRWLFLDGPDPIACAGDEDDPQLTDDEVALVQELAQYVSVIDVEDPNDDEITYKTILFAECNVQIVNGLGATNGYPDDQLSISPDSTEVNGLGNLIVGYNLPDERDIPFRDNTRTGSHNIVVGTRIDYPSFGGLAVGAAHSILGAYTSCLGYSNVASGNYSSVGGGRFNDATGDYSSVSGGEVNEASGRYSSVSGGDRNEASGTRSSVSGGSNNVASGNYSTVSGGVGLTASDDEEYIDPDTPTD